MGEKCLQANLVGSFLGWLVLTSVDMRQRREDRGQEKGNTDPYTTLHSCNKKVIKFTSSSRLGGTIFYDGV